MFLNKKYSELGRLKNSQTQLADDFGEFPPKPLLSGDLPHLFKVKVDSRFKSFAVKVRLCFSCVFLKRKYSFYGVDKEALIINNELTEISEDFKFYDFYEAVTALPLYAKVVALFFLPILLAVFILVSLYSLVIFFYKTSFSLFSTWDSFGSFSGVNAILSSGVPELNISNAGLKLESEDIKAIVSHEHIHYLQYLDCISRSSFLWGGRVVNGHLLFSEAKDSDKKMSSYYFAEHEVEARLHELVVNYYRRYDCLPLDILGLASLVFKSAPVFVAESLGLQGEKVLRWKERNKKSLPHCRSLVVGSDVVMMCESIKSEKEGVRYVYEVLPIFYARLLRYYGDESASQKFSEKIIRPNFYDQLYGGTLS